MRSDMQEFREAVYPGTAILRCRLGIVVLWPFPRSTVMEIEPTPPKRSLADLLQTLKPLEDGFPEIEELPVEPFEL
jgi:hypothetical protein